MLTVLMEIDHITNLQRQVAILNHRLNLLLLVEHLLRLAALLLLDHRDNRDLILLRGITPTGHQM